MELATRAVSDDGVRSALQSGIDAAVNALQKRAGNNVIVKQGVPAPKGGSYAPLPRLHGFVELMNQVAGDGL